MLILGKKTNAHVVVFETGRDHVIFPDDVTKLKKAGDGLKTLKCNYQLLLLDTKTFRAVTGFIKKKAAR